MPYVTWQFMHDRPLQPLVILEPLTPESTPNERRTANPLLTLRQAPDTATDAELTTDAARSLTACLARAHATTHDTTTLDRAEPDL